MAGVLYGEIKFLAGDFERNKTAALALAAALVDFDIKHASAHHGEVPAKLVSRIHPMADRVFVRLGFVLQLGAVDSCVSRVQ